MRRTDLSLDEEIAEVERRLARHRAALRMLASDARNRVGVRAVVPAAAVAALAIGFAASRFGRRPVRPQAAASRGSRPTRMIGAIAAAILPPLIRPLQHVAATWIAERMRRRTAR